jgi:hypothetical protein
VHPSPVLHCISHNGEALAQVEAADQFVYGVFEGINLLRISVMLGPVCNKLFSSISRQPGDQMDKSADDD